MILRVDDNFELNIDNVDMVRWLPSQGSEAPGAGVVIIGGQKISIQNERDFNMIKAAFDRQFSNVIYGVDGKLIKNNKKKGEK